MSATGHLQTYGNLVKQACHWIVTSGKWKSAMHVTFLIYNHLDRPITGILLACILIRDMSATVHGN